MGKPDVSGANWELRATWEDGIEKLANFENVFCKLSGFYNRKY